MHQGQQLYLNFPGKQTQLSLPKTAGKKKRLCTCKKAALYHPNSHVLLACVWYTLNIEEHTGSELDAASQVVKQVQLFVS